MSNNEKLLEVLDGYKVGELKELAKISGLSGYSKLKKAELTESLAAHLQTVDVATIDVPSEIKDLFTTETVNETKEEVKVEEKVVKPVRDLRQQRIIPGTRTIKKDRKIYPNDKCPCGSGKKYKQCCKRA